MNSFELYPVRVGFGQEEDEYGNCMYMELTDVDGGNVKVKFNDSNDCLNVNLMMSGLKLIADELCAKAIWEEQECLRCPGD